MVCKEVDKAVKVRIYPNVGQKIIFHENISHVRYVYNKVKETCEYTYGIIKEHGEKPRNLINRSFVNQILTDLKHAKDFLYDSDSTSLQASGENYIQAMKNFFHGKARYPKYKSKHHPIHSFKVKNNNNSLRIENNKIRIGKHGFCKARGLRNIKGQIRHIVITLVGDKWFASINYKKTPIKPLAPTNKSVGVDVGITDLATLSTGEKITKLNSDKMEKRIAKLQKKLSKQKYASQRWIKTKNKLASAYLKLKNMRNDYIHKLTWKLVNEFDLIKIENLQVSNMLKNHHLAKSISHASWYELKRQLKYKCDWYEKTLEIVPPYNTTKECNKCGYINKDLTLQNRVWKCPKCQTNHDRDVNAAINILNRRNDGDSSTN
jgi:putative transposase